jgi:hypothetical protein
MQAGVPAPRERGPIATTALIMLALLAPLILFLALFPARLLVQPVYAPLGSLGSDGWRAFTIWLAICTLLLLAAVALLARRLGLAPRHRRVFTVVVWLWAMLPNVALIVLL